MNKEEKDWSKLEGYQKDDLVEIEESELNDWLRNKKLKRGYIVAFNPKQRLALIEFRNITWSDKANPERGRMNPLKWASLDKIKKYDTRD